MTTIKIVDGHSVTLICLLFHGLLIHLLFHQFTYSTEETCLTQHVQILYGSYNHNSSKLLLMPKTTQSMCSCFAQGLTSCRLCSISSWIVEKFWSKSRELHSFHTHQMISIVCRAISFSPLVVAFGCLPTSLVERFERSEKGSYTLHVNVAHHTCLVMSFPFLGHKANTYHGHPNHVVNDDLVNDDLQSKGTPLLLTRWRTSSLGGLQLF